MPHVDRRADRRAPLLRRGLVITWLQKKLGITALEEKIERASFAIQRIDKKLRVIRKARRYDQIQRAKKYRRKAAHS